MIVRAAKVSDAEGICELINYYAERGRMLHRSLEGVYNSLRMVWAEGNVPMTCW